MTASANCAGFVMLMLGFRVRVRGWENFAKAKELGAVSGYQHSFLATILLRPESSPLNAFKLKDILSVY